MSQVQDAMGKNALGKEKEEVGIKKARTSAPLRVPLGPNRVQIPQPVTNAVHVRGTAAHNRIHIPNAHKRYSRPIPEPVIVLEEEEEVKEEEPSHDMDVEDVIKHVEQQIEDVNNLRQEREVEAMVGVEVSDDEQVAEQQSPEEDKSSRMWPDVDTEKLDRCQKEVEAIRESYDDVVNMYDTTLVSEYSDDIFDYMEELEVCRPH